MVTAEVLWFDGKATIVEFLNSLGGNDKAFWSERSGQGHLGVKRGTQDVVQDLRRKVCFRPIKA